MTRTINKLTNQEIRAAAYPNEPSKLFDGGGLYLHIQKGGKYWRMKYRFAKKERLLAFGVYPEVSLKEARQRRDEARELLTKKIDPNHQRRLDQTARVKEALDTFGAVAREWYFEVHAHGVVESHAQRNLRRLEVYLLPYLGRRPIVEITAPELLECLRRIEQSGKNETAKRVKNLAGQVFRYGLSVGCCERDIAADLRDALRPVKVVHHPALIDPEEIRPLLLAIDGYGGHPATCVALKLAPLLFVRPGELRQAEWASFDLDNAEWKYLPSKKGLPLIVSLPVQAVVLLREIFAITGEGRYVFPSIRGDGRPMSENTINGALHSLGFKDKMTGHGFRAMARTVLAERLNVPPEYIEQHLAHAVKDANGRAYNRTTFLEQRKEMLQTWADYLEALKIGEDR